MILEDTRQLARGRSIILITLFSLFLLFALSACSKEKRATEPREEEAGEIIDSYFAEGQVGQTTPFQMPEEQPDHDEYEGVYLGDELRPYEELYRLDSDTPIESYARLEEKTDIQVFPDKKLVRVFVEYKGEKEPNFLVLTSQVIEDYATTNEQAGIFALPEGRLNCVFLTEASEYEIGRLLYGIGGTPKHPGHPGSSLQLTLYLNGDLNQALDLSELFLQGKSAFRLGTCLDLIGQHSLCMLDPSSQVQWNDPDAAIINTNSVIQLEKDALYNLEAPQQLSQSLSPGSQHILEIQVID